jgi:DivIVA domain-containing protein
MSILFAVIAILVIAGAVAYAMGRGSGLAAAEPDRRPQDVGDSTTFDVVLRGYRMDEVDARIEQLEAENRALRGPQA